MLSLLKYPFLRLLICFAIGIICEDIWQIEISLLLSILLACLVIILAQGFSSLAFLRQISSLRTICIVSTFFCLGASLHYYQNNGFRKMIFTEDRNDFSLYRGVIQSVTPKKKSYQIKLQLCNAENLALTSNYVLLYSSNANTVNPSLKYGDLIAVKTHLQPIQNFEGSTFDYAAYCRREHILGQGYVGADKLEFIVPNQGNALVSQIQNIKKWSIAKLKSNISDSLAVGMAEALLIGEKADLDKDVLQQFTQLGIIHIIAISGMHLVLLYGLIHFVVVRIIQKKYRWLQFLVEMALLWGFSIMAGAGPSIVRAAVMFTVMLLGSLFGRKYNSINGLLASAFLLLSYDTNWLWNVGFQLSFTAVLGILVFYQPIVRLSQYENKLLQRIWTMAAVSLAAQIFTFPLILFYFRQFPVWFLVANLLIIPISDMLLNATILLLLLPLGAKWMGKLLEWIVDLTLIIIHRLNLLPLQNIQFQSFSLLQTILSYAAIFLFLYLIVAKRKRILWYRLLG